MVERGSRGGVSLSFSVKGTWGRAPFLGTLKDM
jgi:hypothetical protein